MGRRVGEGGKSGQGLDEVHFAPSILQSDAHGNLRIRSRVARVAIKQTTTCKYKKANKNFNGKLYASSNAFRSAALSVAFSTEALDEMKVSSSILFSLVRFHTGWELACDV